VPKKSGKDRRNVAIALVALLMFAAGVADGIAVQKFDVPGYLFHKSPNINETSIPTTSDETSTPPWPKTISLKTREFEPSMKEGIYDTERDSEYIYNQRLLDLDKTAIIVVDAWASYPNDGWLNRAQENMSSKLKPLLDLARYHNMIVIHAPNGQEIADIVKPIKDEFIVDSKNEVPDTTELDSYLQAHHITTLLYAGYASNWCLLNRPTGIFSMKRIGYDIILVRDCTIAFEMPETLDSEAANLVIINLIENQFGATTTLDDLKTALQ
jgi:nicotinamidase-related amidase